MFIILYDDTVSCWCRLQICPKDNIFTSTRRTPSVYLLWSREVYDTEVNEQVLWGPRWKTESVQSQNLRNGAQILYSVVILYSQCKRNEIRGRRRYIFIVSVSRLSTDNIYRHMRWDRLFFSAVWGWGEVYIYTGRGGSDVARGKLYRKIVRDFIGFYVAFNIILW